MGCPRLPRPMKPIRASGATVGRSHRNNARRQRLVRRVRSTAGMIRFARLANGGDVRTDRTPLIRRRGRDRAVARRGTGQLFDDPRVGGYRRRSGRFRVWDVSGGSSLGFAQFALVGAPAVQAPEDGVLVAASVQAKRIAGGEGPRIAVLRPIEDGGGGGAVVGSAPLPGSSARGSVDRGRGPASASPAGRLGAGFLFRGEQQVGVGVRMRAQPDGAMQLFSLPCEPCRWAVERRGRRAPVRRSRRARRGRRRARQRYAGSGRRRLGPGLGGAGLRTSRRATSSTRTSTRTRPAGSGGEIRLLDADRRSGGRASLLLRVPKAGRVSAAVTLPANRRTGAGPFQTILTGDKRVRRAGRVRLRLAATPRRRPRPGPAPAGAHEGGRGVLPPPGAADAPDALGPALTAAAEGGAADRVAAGYVVRPSDDAPASPDPAPRSLNTGRATAVPAVATAAPARPTRPRD